MMINESRELFFAKASSLGELLHLYFHLWWNNYNSELGLSTVYAKCQI